MSTQNSSLTKSELSETMQNISQDMMPKEADFATHSLLEIMAQTLIDGDRIEVRGFGTWETRYLPPRTAHNPRTGEKVATIGKFRPHFKAGKALKSLVNQYFLKNDLKQGTQYSSELADKKILEEEFEDA